MREILRFVITTIGLAFVFAGLYTLARGTEYPRSIPFLISVGLVMLAIRFVFLRRGTGPKLVLQITGVPPGEAPLWVREQWVGLELPAFQTRKTPLRLSTSGVLSGSKGFWSSLWASVSGKAEKTTGYLVTVESALRVLENKHPEAAAWWRENAPHLCNRFQLFVFPAEVATIVSGVSGAASNGA